MSRRQASSSSCPIPVCQCWTRLDPRPLTKPGGNARRYSMTCRRSAFVPKPRFSYCRLHVARLHSTLLVSLLFYLIFLSFFSLVSPSLFILQFKVVVTNSNTDFQGNMTSISTKPANPQQPVSDMGPQFNANEFQEGSREFEQGMHFNNYISSLDEIGLVSDEFGFLGRFDLPDISSWFSDIPM